MSRLKSVVHSSVFVIALLSYSTAPACAQQPSDGGTEVRVLSEAEKLYGLSLIWKEASDYFVYFDQVPDLDWDAAFRDYIPRVLAAQNLTEYYLELKRFAVLLQDGHTSVTFPEEVSDTFAPAAGIGVREIDRRAWILNVARGLQEQAPLGSEIVAVDGVPTAEYLRTDVFPLIPSSTDHVRWKWGIEGYAAAGFGLLVRPEGTEIVLTVRNPQGGESEVKIVCEYPEGGTDWVRGPSTSSSFDLEWPEEDIAYVQISTFNSTRPVEQFGEALPELRRARGIIIDLRRNGGGSTSNAKAILQHFTSVPLEGARWKTRQLRGAHKAWGRFMPDDEEYAPYADGSAWYDGGVDVLQPGPGPVLDVPVIVLIGPNTASAAEDFLLYARHLQGFTFMGEPTYGSTGQPIFFDLPGGGTARVCAKRDQFPDGTDWVGVGIIPDIKASRTVASYLEGDTNQGVDNVLREAVVELKRRLVGGG